MNTEEIKKFPLAESGDQVTIASGPVIFDDLGQVLLTKDQKDNFWKFPGGTLHFGESLTECARREAIEETGLPVTLADQAPYAILVTQNNPDNSIHYILLWHWLAILDHIPTIFTSPEGLEVSWFSESQLDTIEVGPNVRPTLNHFKSK